MLERGYAVSADANSADVIVVNTCTVTAAADSQARRAIDAIHRGNPGARIVVTGCYAQRSPEGTCETPWSFVGGGKFAQARNSATHSADGAGFTGRRFAQVCLHIRGREQTHSAGAISHDRGPAQILTGDISRQRELIVAPVEAAERGYAAGAENSGWLRQAVRVLRDSSMRRTQPEPFAGPRDFRSYRKLAEGGASEVGVERDHIGNDGHDLAPRTNLRDLLRRMLDEAPIERLRVSSIEPIDVSEDLIALFAASDRLARHFHMPLQSGRTAFSRRCTAGTAPSTTRARAEPWCASGFLTPALART